MSLLSVFLYPVPSSLQVWVMAWWWCPPTSGSITTWSSALHSTTFSCPWQTCCHGLTATTPGTRQTAQVCWAAANSSTPVWLMLPAACWPRSPRWSTAPRGPAPVRSTGSKALLETPFFHFFWWCETGIVTWKLVWGLIFIFTSVKNGHSEYHKTCVTSLISHHECLLNFGQALISFVANFVLYFLPSYTLLWTRFVYLLDITVKIDLQPQDKGNKHTSYLHTAFKYLV